jgi:hypothetical protein
MVVFFFMGEKKKDRLPQALCKQAVAMMLNKKS